MERFSEITIERLYGLFNSRDIEAVLAMLHPEVAWANGQHGGHVTGRAGVRDYWTEQWTTIDPTVTPEQISQTADGRWRVRVHQVVRDPSGAVVSERRVEHLFTTDKGLIRRFDIGYPDANSAAAASPQGG